MFAVYHRDFHGGKGQEIDVALYEGIFRLMNQVEEHNTPASFPSAWAIQIHWSPLLKRLSPKTVSGWRLMLERIMYGRDSQKQ